MTLAEAMHEARAIDGRALGGLIAPVEDILRAMELVEYFDAVVQDETNEVQRAELAKWIVSRLA